MWRCLHHAQHHDLFCPVLSASSLSQSVCMLEGECYTNSAEFRDVKPLQASHNQPPLSGTRHGRGRSRSYVPHHVKHPEKYTCYILDEPLVVGGGDRTLTPGSSQADQEQVSSSIAHAQGQPICALHRSFCHPGVSPCFVRSPSVPRIAFGINRCSNLGCMCQKMNWHVDQRHGLRIGIPC